MEAPRRKPRIRKTTPTVRERAEAARAETEKEKPRRVRKALSSVGAPIGRATSRLKLPDNRFTRPLKTVGRFIKKILRPLVPRYFANAWRELKLVSWPSRRETWRLTGAVFIFSLVFGVIVASVDKGLDELFRKLILK